jgi:hypothetical protein
MATEPGHPFGDGNDEISVKSRSLLDGAHDGP